MRKIKGFKIQIYHKEIARRLKKAGIDLSSAGLADGKALEEFVCAAAAKLEPSVVFDSFPADDHSMYEATPVAGSAFSAGAVTLGRSADEKILSITDPLTREIAAVAMAVFMETAIKFVLDLIEEEVRREGLEPGPIQYLFSPPQDLYTASTRSAQICEFAGQTKPSPEILEKLGQKLEFPKIGIHLNEGSGCPRYTAVFSIPWLVKRKKTAK